MSLDGSATVYVNSSLAALNALRGASFVTDPAVPVDRAEVREFYTTPVTRVLATPTVSRQSGRWFVHVRLDVSDVRRLGEAVPFSWSTYALTRDADRYVFRQKIGAAASVNGGTSAGWTGNELVAFRLHLPSEIVYHNAGPGNRRRGNILVWEQSLADRRRGEPLVLDARMKTESILYSTLKLFGVTFLVVAALFVLLIWWILRHGRPAGASS